MASGIEEIWTEKYRPRRLADIVGQRHVIERLQHFVEKRSLPHMLFAGPAGIGKTTAALALANELYGDQWHGNFLEMNASVTGDTPVMIRINDQIKRTNFYELEKLYFKGNEERVSLDNLEVLSLDNSYKVRFMPANYLFRHKKSKIAIIHFEGGAIKTSLDHSVFTISENGSLVSKPVQDMKEGDFLLTFKMDIGGNVSSVSLENWRPKKYLSFKNRTWINPKVKADFSQLELDDEFSWILGFYMAEGCTSLSKTNTGGQTIFTVAYPKEIDLGDRVKSFFEGKGITVSSGLGRSGFDRSKESSLQIRALNTQIAKFMRSNFYDNDRKNAHTKRVPQFIYSAPLNVRLTFLKGYFQGDGSGRWGKVARLSSVSQECLIDAAWMGRLSGLETSCFEREARIIWKVPEFSYTKSEVIPAFLMHRLNKELGLEKTYELRHSLYSKKSSRIAKSIAASVITDLGVKNETLVNVRKFIESDLSVAKIKSIEIVDYDDFVYDISVPGSQMFWGGTIPVLLHNSDERGIDTVRHKVKEFARTIPLNGLFKIVYLDEADSLTKDAQHALRRTMENYAHICRFILACNYSGKIISPVQSRCAVFRFSALSEKDVIACLQAIARKEKLSVDDNALKAIFRSAEGDLRKAINILQMASPSKKITEQVVQSATSRANPEEVRKMVEVAWSGSFRAARELLSDLMYAKGLSGEDIIRELHNQVMGLAILDTQKMALIERVGEYEFRLTEGSNPQIQLEALLAQIALMGRK